MSKNKPAKQEFKQAKPLPEPTPKPDPRPDPDPVPPTPEPNPSPIKDHALPIPAEFTPPGDPFYHPAPIY